MCAGHSFGSAWHNFVCARHSFGSGALGAIDNLGPPAVVGVLHLALGAILKLTLVLYLAFLFYLAVLPLMLCLTSRLVLQLSVLLAVVFRCYT